VVSRLLEARIECLEGLDVESAAGEGRMFGTEGVEEPGGDGDAVLGALAVVEDEELYVVLVDVLADVTETI